MDVSDKSQAVVGGTLGRGGGDAGGVTRRLVRVGEPVFFWGWHAGHRQPTAVPVAQIVQKSARVRKEQRKCTHLRQAEH